MDKINSLRSKVKRYIHDLEMAINQKGQALTVMQLREERVRVQQRVEELEARIALQEREYLEARPKRIDQGSGFPHHLARVLVISQAHEFRVAQMIRVCPL
jgi:hypothetical protein